MFVRSKVYPTVRSTDTSASLVLQVMEITEEDTDDGYVITLYGVCDDGATVSLHVTDFEPFLHIPIPENWGRSDVEAMIEQIGPSLVSEWKIVHKQVFYGFQNNAKRPFLRVNFRRKRQMSFFQRKIENYQSRSAKGFRFECWESRLPAFLRFIHRRKLGCAGWIEVKGGMYELLRDHPTTTCVLCARTDWRSVRAIERDSIAPFVIASMDIEADSSHGEFPLAKKDYRKVVVDIWNASSALQRRFDYLSEHRTTAPPEEDAERVRLAEAIADPDALFRSLLMETTGLRASEGRIHQLRLKEPADYNDVDVLAEEVSYLGEWRRLYRIRSMQSERAKTADYSPELLDGYKSPGDAAKALTDSLGDLLNQRLPPIKGDPVIQIGLTVHRYGEQGVFYRYIGTLKGCAPIEGVNVESFKTEKGLLLAFAKQIRKVDPDFLTGYNVFGFDWKYLWHRAEELGIAEDFSKMGRRLPENGDTKPMKSELEMKSLSSSALGDNFLYYIPMEGRVQLDLMKEVQKNHKLDSYKLDTVAATFMRGSVKKREPASEGGAWLTVDSIGKVVPGRFLQFNINDGIREDSWRAGEKVRVLDVRADPPSFRVEDAMEDLVLKPPFKVKYCEVKNDIHPEDIFRLQKGSDEDRRTIAEYCIQDCELCNRLIDKLEIIANSVGMANVCLVPMSFLFFRGQGIKIFSLVAKQCSEEGYLIPPSKANQKREEVEEEEEEKEGYEGAIVLKAFTDIHYMPVSVADFNSLYPSCMISHNLSHDSIVLDPKYDNLPGYEYETVEYDNYVYVAKPGTKVVEKKINEREPKKRVRYVQPKKDADGTVIEASRGILPRILQRLLKARKDTRTKQKAFAKSDFRWSVLEGLQLAYKVTANSLYGQVGASTSHIYLKEIAASTTAVGRQNLIFAKDYVEANYPGSKAVYGDSVMPYTPITILRNGKISVISIQDLASTWEPYEEFKPFDTTRTDKEQAVQENTLVWTHQGWKKIVRVIRHKTAKKIYRVLTHTGLIDVTEDHSLLSPEGGLLNPGDLSKGTKLMHGDPSWKDQEIEEPAISPEQARIFGMFVGDGMDSCDSGQKSSWAINNADYALLEDYREHCYSGKAKIVPEMVMNSSNPEVHAAFLRGLFESDGNRKENAAIGCLRIDTKNQVTAQSYYLFLKKMGFSVSIHTRTDKPDVFRLTYTKAKQRKASDVIKKIEVMHNAYEGHVYDLETEAGTFHGGVGRLIVKNTDSVFLYFETRYPEDHPKAGQKMTGIDAIHESMRLCIKAGEEVSNLLPRPHNWDFEKTIYPFLLLSKKRYCGAYYTDLESSDYYINSMGIVLKRRDNAPIVKHIYGSVIDELMRGVWRPEVQALLEAHPEMDVREVMIRRAQKLVVEETRKVLEGKFPMSYFVISKTLRAEYANEQSIAHKVLANRMADRDPGSAPQSNDRVQYVYITNPSATLQGDKIEDVAYVEKNKLPLDYRHYVTNQIATPVAQIFGLVLESLDGYKPHLHAVPDHPEMDDKRRGDVRTDMAIRILFEPLLNEYDQRKRGQRAITSYYTPAGATRAAPSGPAKPASASAGSLTPSTVRKAAAAKSAAPAKSQGTLMSYVVKDTVP